MIGYWEIKEKFKFSVAIALFLFFIPLKLLAGTKNTPNCKILISHLPTWIVELAQAHKFDLDQFFIEQKITSLTVLLHDRAKFNAILGKQVQALRTILYEAHEESVPNAGFLYPHIVSLRKTFKAKGIKAKISIDAIGRKFIIFVPEESLIEKAKEIVLASESGIPEGYQHRYVDEPELFLPPIETKVLSNSR